MAGPKKDRRERGGAKADPGRAARPSVAPASPGGPNRQARKDEARREREALQRKMARRQTLKVVVIALSVLLVGGGLTAFVTLRPSAAEAAGCGPLEHVAQFNPSSEDRSHIGTSGSPVATAPPLSAYASSPPTSGPHDASPLAAGVYTGPPDVYHTIHSLEHGAAIIWYSPSAVGSAELARIQEFYRQPVNNDHVIVAEFSYPDQGAAGSLAAGKQIVMVYWHHLMSCSKASLAAVQSFVAHYRIPSTGIPPAGYPRDGAPEPGAAI